MKHDILAARNAVGLGGSQEGFLAGGEFAHREGFVVEHYCCICKRAAEARTAYLSTRCTLRTNMLMFSAHIC